MNWAKVADKLKSLSEEARKVAVTNSVYPEHLRQMETQNAEIYSGLERAIRAGLKETHKEGHGPGPDDM